MVNTAIAFQRALFKIVAIEIFIASKKYPKFFFGSFVDSMFVNFPIDRFSAKNPIWIGFFVTLVDKNA